MLNCGADYFSFFLTEKGFLRKDKGYKKNRIFRLVWPQIGWAFIYWGAGLLLYILFDIQTKIGLKDVLWQILTGHRPVVNMAMWYQNVLAVITVLFFAIFWFFPGKVGVIVLAALAMFALFLQYSGINYQLFAELRYELRFPLGRFCEMVPCAVAGFMVAHSRILKKCEKYRAAAIGVLAVLILWLKNVSVLPAPEGFYYAGLKNIFMAVALVSIAYLLPMEKIPEKLQKVIQQMTRYTLAVYCMHNLIGRYMEKVFERLDLESGTFLMCCLIYVSCYIIAFFMSKFPIKLCKQLVE